MSLEASEGYVVVELLPNTNVTDAAIQLPLSTKGTVVSDGGDEDGYEQYSEGDVVHFYLHNSYRLNRNGNEYLAVPLGNVLAVEVDD